jgi:hypothetical protein
VVEFEGEGLADMQLLNGCERVVKQLCLVEVLLELGGVKARFHGCDLLGEVDIAAISGFGGWWDDRFAVRPIVHIAGRGFVAESAVAVVVHHGTDRAVDGEFLEVDSEARDLSVKVGEVAALEERVI